MKRIVTIKDVARKLGISPSTVSRALRDNPELSSETKRKVREAVEELNYQPNPIALSLRQNKTNSIGVIIPEIVHFYFSTVISGIEEITYQNGYHALITQSNELYDREKDNCKALYESRVDGFLIGVSKKTENFDHILALMDKGFPVVFLDRAVDVVDCSVVKTNDLLGGYKATRHLIEQGCQKIAHISGPENLIVSKERKKGYENALKEAHLNAPLIISLDYPLVSSDHGTLKNFIEEHQPDGVFIHNDMIAIQLLELLNKWNYKVPAQIKVIGYSNWFFTKHTTPSLSTVEQYGYDLGKSAAELLLNEIKGKKDEFIEPQKILVEPEVVVRASSVNPE